MKKYKIQNLSHKTSNACVSLNKAQDSIKENWKPPSYCTVSTEGVILENNLEKVWYNLTHFCMSSFSVK
jgi:hypothetical protein